MVNLKPSGTDMMNNAVLMIVNCNGIGNSKSVSSSMVEIDANLDYIKVSKTLLDSKQLRAINAHFSALKRYLNKRALRTHFKSGAYAIPMDRIEEVDTKIAIFEMELAALVREFVEVYDIQCEAARANLGSAYDASDYPPTEVVARSFSITWEYFSTEVPDALNRVSPALYKRQKEQLAKKMDEIQNDVVYLIRDQATKMMGQLVQSLTENSDGSKKVIKDSSLEKVRVFLNEFQTINITNDVELEGVLNQVGALLSGVDCSELRNSETFREDMRGKFMEITDTLEGMMKDAPRRRISIEEDE